MIYHKVFVTGLCDLICVFVVIDSNDGKSNTHNILDHDADVCNFCTLAYMV